MNYHPGLNMPLREAMLTQRAIRRLKPDPVDDDLILQLIELALKAPTGSNAQNWEFIIVKDPQIKKIIARRNRQAWKIYKKLGELSGRIDAKTRRIVAAVQWQADHFQEIPVIVVPCLRGFRVPLPHFFPASYFGSIFPAVQNFLLAARAVNLGATLITLPLMDLFTLRRVLRLPPKITPCALIPLGWPRGRYGPTTRKPVHEVVSYDVYGNRHPVTDINGIEAIRQA